MRSFRRAVLLAAVVLTTGFSAEPSSRPTTAPTTGWTALLEAVVYGDESAPYQEIVRILLAAGADLGIRDAKGRTALDHAVAHGQEAVADILRGSLCAPIVAP